MPEPGRNRKKSSERKGKKSNVSEKKKSVKKATRPNKIKPNPEDGIAKSKQLVLKIQTSSTRSKSVGSKPLPSKNSEVRICGNGKPMPSLAELEKMFEDSDTEDEGKAPPCNNPCTSTPEPAPQPPQNPVELTSPKTIAKIANKMLDVLSNLTEVTESTLLDDNNRPPPPVVKPKKRKKSDIPYIVGCKDRPYVPTQPNNSVFKGEEEYGINENDRDDEDDIPKKRAKRGKKVNMSKSIFNAASDEIAARLKEQYDGEASSDSNKTVAYEYYTPNNNRVRSFSPLPSTSKDNETFVRNDQLFNKSLLSENASATCDDNDIEVVGTPCETIVVNDTMTTNLSSMVIDPSVIEVIDDSAVEQPNSYNKNAQTTSVDDDDSIQIVDITMNSPIPVDEYYCNLCNKSTVVYHDEDCEIIDVDDIIAENTAIINKYNRKSNLDTVTSVDMRNSFVSHLRIVDESNSTNINFNNIMPNPSVPHHDVWEIGGILTVAPMAVTPIAMVPNDMQPLGNTLLDLDIYRGVHVPRTMEMPSNVRRPTSMQNNVVPSMNFNLLNPSCQFVDQDTNQRTHQRPQGDTSPSMNTDDGRSKRIADCPICMDQLYNKPVASTMCGHLFCMNCIRLAIKSNGKKCPTCRKALRGPGFHQIFL